MLYHLLPSKLMEQTSVATSDKEDELYKGPGQAHAAAAHVDDDVPGAGPTAAAARGTGPWLHAPGRTGPRGSRWAPAKGKERVRAARAELGERVRPRGSRGRPAANPRR